MTTDGRIVRPTLGRRGFEVYDLNMELVESFSWERNLDVEALARAYEEQRRRGTPSSFAWQSGDGSSGYIPVPFYPGGARHYDREGTVWIGLHEHDPTGYRIRRQNLARDTTLIVESWKSLVPVTREEREAAIQEIREYLRERGADTDRDWSAIPDVKPSITNLFTSEEGNIWVRTSSSGGDATWDVHSADGAWLGTASASGFAPSIFVNAVVSGDEFWAVVTDAFDVPYVVRARITPSD